MWLALSTQTSPADWWNEDDATIATAVDMVTEAAERLEKRRG